MRIMRIPFFVFVISGFVHQAAAGFSIYTPWPFDAVEAKRRQQETSQATRNPVELTVLLPGGIPLTFVLLPAGKAILGNPPGDAKVYEGEDRHQYTQTQPLYVGKFHVTREQYNAAVGHFPTATRGGTGPKMPAVAWMDEVVDQVIPAIQKSMPAGLSVRLPSRDEWEYACRAGVPNNQYFTLGNTEADLARGAWYKANSGDMMHDVGLKEPNAWGLYDMQGNMWQYDNAVASWDVGHQYRFAYGGAYWDDPWNNGIRISNEWGTMGDPVVGFRLFATVAQNGVGMVNRTEHSAKSSGTRHRPAPLLNGRLPAQCRVAGVMRPAPISK